MQELNGYVKLFRKILVFRFNKPVQQLKNYRQREKYP